MNKRTNSHIVTRLAVAALLSTIFAMAAAAEGKPASGSFELQAFSSAPTADCQALPAASDSSASSSSSAGTLCVSVSWSEASVERGQAAVFTVQVSAPDGPVPSTSVTLSAAPSGQEAVFTADCPSADGAATCTLGQLDTSTTPESFTMQAAITVPAGDSSVSGVTLTATAQAASSPAMTTLPAAAGTIAETAPPATSKPSPTPTQTSAKPTPKPSATKSAPATTPTTKSPSTGTSGPGTSGTSTVGTGTVAPGTWNPGTVAPIVLPSVGSSTTVISPGSATGLFPDIAPSSAPATAAGVPPTTPGALTSAPASGNLSAAAQAAQVDADTTRWPGAKTAVTLLVVFFVLASGLMLLATRAVPWRRRRGPGRHSIAAKPAAITSGPNAVTEVLASNPPSLPRPSATQPPGHHEPPKPSTDTTRRNRPWTDDAPPGQYLG